MMAVKGKKYKWEDGKLVEIKPERPLFVMEHSESLVKTYKDYENVFWKGWFLGRKIKSPEQIDRELKQMNKMMEEKNV